MTQKAQWEEEFDAMYAQKGYELLLKSPNHFQTCDVTYGIKSFIHSLLAAKAKEVCEKLEKEIAYADEQYDDPAVYSLKKAQQIVQDTLK